MKAHKRLMQSLRAIANPHTQKPREWQASHPVTCGAIPVVNYVPPSGNCLTPSSPNYETHVEANLARVSILELAH